MPLVVIMSIVNSFFVFFLVQGLWNGLMTSSIFYAHQFDSAVVFAIPHMLTHISPVDSFL